MHRLIALLLATLLLATLLFACGESNDDQSRSQSEDVCSSAPVEGAGFDRYGGWKAIALAPAARFRVAEVEGVWWFVTPDGHALYSNGPTGIDPIGDYVGNTDRSPYHEAVLAKYGSDEAWADGTVARLCELGIRTHGGWLSVADSRHFSGRIPYSLNTSFYGEMPEVVGAPPSAKPRRDVFDATASARARALAHQEGGVVQRCAGDPWCIGVFVENELPWAPSLLAGGSHLDVYLAESPGGPGKLALQSFFARRYRNDIAAFNRAWGTTLASFDDLQQLDRLGSCAPTLGFADDLCALREGEARFDDRMHFEAEVAARTAMIADEALAEVDPLLLNLGARITAEPAHPAVVAALAQSADVMSINNYDISAAAAILLPPAVQAQLEERGMLPIDVFARLRRVHEITPKPLLISEWFYRVARADIGSYPPILPEVPTPAEQAAAYRSYMDEILAMPFVIGEHWFQWVDQPREGRFDRENQLIGLVSVEDELNQPLAATVAEVNGTLLSARASFLAERE